MKIVKLFAALCRLVLISANALDATETIDLGPSYVSLDL